MDFRIHAKHILRRGNHLLNAGETDRALACFQRAFDTTQDYGDATEAAYYLPRIRHSLALAHGQRGDYKRAKKNYQLSLELFESSNYIGRARTMRDFGWLEFTHGKEKVGRTLIQGALDILLLENDHDERWQREWITTEGYVARLSAKTDPLGTIAKLREVHAHLHGGEKWIYELDNLQFLISLLPVTESLNLRVRAFVLNERICMTEDAKVLIDDIIMGQPVHGAVRLMVRSTKRRMTF